ncbi:HPF/RaiA family ribosome-associated protein [Terriglobus sp.]|uniref:HPF/RaiA family ribosome-associated protein n=1 Tax=Terriglobus sp. TaxID=1889013 RepID=UPI003B003BF5
MDLEITGRGTTVTQVLRQQAEAGLERIERILGPKSSAKVVLTCEKNRCVVELAIFSVLHDLSAKCEAKVPMHQEAQELAAALAEALNKVESQALKNKKKVVTTRHHPEQNALGSIRLQTDDDIDVNDIDPESKRLGQSKTGIGKAINSVDDGELHDEQTVA